MGPNVTDWSQFPSQCVTWSVRNTPKSLIGNGLGDPERAEAVSRVVGFSHQRVETVLRLRISLASLYWA